MSIRMLHFADLHVGMENYGKTDPTTGTSTRVRDFLDRLDELIKHALDNEADLAVFAGDAFKRLNPNPTYQREFAQRIKRLADVVPTLLLIGNHDMPRMASKASSIDIFQVLDVPGVIVGSKPEGQVIETRRGNVYLAWIPYLMRNRLVAAEDRHGSSIEELDILMRQITADILNGLTEGAREHDMPRVLVGHLTVSEAVYGSERSVMLGSDVTVPVSQLADPAWDYVALGHIHRHQSMNGDGYPSVVYSGSLERIDFGEEKEDKGFCWVELERSGTKWEFIPVAARSFHTVTVDVRKSEDPMQTVLAALQKAAAEDAVVRVIVQLRPDQRVAVRERGITDALLRATNVSVVYEVEQEVRARLGSSDIITKELTPAELLEKYFESKGKSPERIEALLATAADLIEE